MDNSDDDISITSTVQSELKEEYDVEAILGEWEFEPNLTSYLVKWAGYPLERCTWEPPKSFRSAQTLDDWALKKEAIAQGKEAPFDFEPLLERIREIDEAQKVRKSKRKAKRIRLGIPVSPSVSS